MEPAIVISVLSLAVACAALLWNSHTWRVARRTDVRVMAWHDGAGLDILAGSGSVEAEHVIALRVFNYGERPEYVMWTGLQSAAGEPLVNDRPTAAKLVDEPPPVPREVPPRGQLAVQFNVPAAAIAEGFVGYAALGAGEWVYSVPARPDPGLADIHSQVLEIAADIDATDET